MPPGCQRDHILVFSVPLRGTAGDRDRAARVQSEALGAEKALGTGEEGGGQLCLQEGKHLDPKPGPPGRGLRLGLDSRFPYFTVLPTIPFTPETFPRAARSC